MVWIKWGIEGILLIGMSGYDLKERRIPLVLIVGYGLIGSVFMIQQSRILGDLICSVWLLLAGWIAAMIVKGGIGNGDRWIIGLLPLWHGLKSSLVLIGVSMVAAGLFGISYWLLRRNKAYLIPYLPFITAAVLLIR